MQVSPSRVSYAGDMAKKEKDTPKQTTEDSALTAAAKAIGNAVGKVAAMAGVAAPSKPKAPKIPKLVKKNKSRLPRKEKKALLKATKRQEAAK